LDARKASVLSGLQEKFSVETRSKSRIAQISRITGMISGRRLVLFWM
jgi:hypothetical protein